MTNNNNVAIVQRGYDAFNRGDIEVMLSMLAPEFEWIEPAGSPFGGVFRTPKELIEKSLIPFGTEFDGKMLADEYIENGDKIVARGQLVGTHRRTGRKATIRYAAFIELRDGKLVRLEHIFDSALYVRLAE